jgi:hypothetical protein
MALSNAEKVKRYRERQKAKKQAEVLLPTPPSDVFKKPFFEFFTPDDQVSGQYVQSLELGGMQPLLFEDDSGPEVATLDDLSDRFEESGFSNPFGDAKGTSLGKAEILIGCLLDAASDLAAWVNEYKKAEIKARIAEVENSELVDADAKRVAFAKMAALNQMLADLEKQARIPIPVWKVDLHEDLLKN